MRLARKSHLAVVSMVSLLAGLAAATACGLDDRTLEEGEEHAGTIELSLQVGDVTLNTLTYEITGNGFSKQGVINVGRSKTISTLIGGIPAGTGYNLVLSGADATNSAILCSATAPFNVTAGRPTLVVLKLLCRLPDAKGSVQISGSANVCPRIDALSVEPSEAIVGETLALSSEVTDSDDLPVPATYHWTSTGGSLAGETSASATFTCTEPGAFTITLQVSDGDCGDTDSATVTCSPDDEAPPAPPLIKVNEVESSGGVPGDWTELLNAGAAAADLSGFVFKDNDDTHAYVIPAGTVVASGGFYVIEEAAQGFGLGSGDSARLFDPAGALVDSFTWTAHATTTYGRCPDGTGAFGTSSSSTKGLANACAPVGPTTFAWPGQNTVAPVDVPGQFTSNLSGLTYEPPTASSTAVLWAVVNGPGTLFRMLWDGAAFTPDPSGDWGAGKALRYTTGLGNPDSEGVTFGASVADGMYVATERNNDASTVSRLSVLRFDVSVPGASLTATHDWDLTGNLPVVGANLGLEAVTWVPDSFLTGKAFFDEAAGHTYVPAEYPDHGAGLFFVGIEGNGQIYGFALNHVSGAFTRIATIASSNPGVMGLEFDRGANYLWSSCDDTCGNKSAILDIDTTPGSPTLGRFFVRRQFDPPSTLPDANNEGIAIGPESECVGGFKPFFWSDDNDTGGQSLRRDSIPCGPFL